MSVGDNLCSYCLGAKQLSGPDSEDVTCPKCRGTGVYPFLINSETATGPSKQTDRVPNLSRKFALAAIRRVLGAE